MLVDAVQGVGEPNSTLTGEEKKRPDCLGACTRTAKN